MSIYILFNCYKTLIITYRLTIYIYEICSKYLQRDHLQFDFFMFILYIVGPGQNYSKIGKSKVWRNQM